MAGLTASLTSAAVKMACDKLGSAIGGQVNLFWNFNNNLEDMKDTLESIAAVLKDAERRSVREESVQLWLKRLKHAAMDISDMLDDSQVAEEAAKMKGMLSCLPIAPKKIILANKMKSMREKLRKIAEQHRNFNFTLDTSVCINQQHYDQRETTSDVNDAEIVGREGEKQAIINLLLARENIDETMILPIFGLGGMGKTTLAGLVYNDTQFKKYNHRVWVYVSQEFDLKKIGNTIISQVQTEGQHNIDTMQLMNQRLDDLLPGKKILVVLDDIWEEKDTELERLKRMLRVGKQDSQVDVIVTTRLERIAKKICTNKPYMLQPLKDDMCWDIIKKISQFENKGSKAQFEQIGLDIANKCGGVALAAQALGYMLKSSDLNRWSEVNNSDIWNESSRDEDSPHNTVLPSLKLSYESMQPNLRLCFAYCAIFPKGRDIVKDDLIHQWMALDFIGPSIRQGEEYVTQLLGMSFLQHSKLPSTARKHARYNMHHLVHDLARSVMGDELIIFDSAARTNTSQQKYCRYALLKNYTQTGIFAMNVRALSFSGNSKLNIRDGGFSFAKCLRILDFSECTSLVFPASIGILKQLRYLIAPRIQNDSLPGCITEQSKLQYLNLHESSQISAIPESIGKLTGLKFLDFSGCSSILNLPESFGDLKKLMHLDLSSCSRIEQLSESFGNLENLMHLDLSTCSKITELPASVGNLTNLLHLELSDCKGFKDMHESFCGLTNLQYLNLSNCINLRRLPKDIGNLARLQYCNLSSCYNIVEMPESFQDLQNLVHLDMSRCYSVRGVLAAVGGLTALQHLDVSNLSDLHLEDLDMLGNLTDLRYLNLSKTLDPWPHQDTHSGRESCTYIEIIGGLTNLQHLDLSLNQNLGYLPGNLGNLRKLHTLNLRGCKGLMSLPGSIDALTLKSLLVEGCSDELTDHINSRFNNYLLTLPLFKVRANGSSARSNLHQLKHVNPDDLKIHFLENVRFLEEADAIKLADKNNVLKLQLSWTLDTDRHLEDKDLLGALLPPESLKHLWMKGYSSLSLPTWLMCFPCYLSNLVSITLLDFPFCFYLPSLGQLPNLEYLRFDNLAKIKSIDGDFCGGKGAFRRLSRFDLARMNGLEWNTTYHDEVGVEDFMFPMLDELNIMSCPHMSLKPCPPIFHIWRITNSDEVIEGSNISQPWIPRCIRLQISSKCYSGGWGLLHHLPALQELELIDCPNLMALPESMRHLSFLRSLELMTCQSISALPEWIGDLKSLEILSIKSCERIKSLPSSIQQLTNLQTLHIIWNPELKQWCQSEENKTKLAHIKDVMYEFYHN